MNRDQLAIILSNHNNMWAEEIEPNDADYELADFLIRELGSPNVPA